MQERLHAALGDMWAIHEGFLTGHIWLCTVYVIFQALSSSATFKNLCRFSFVKGTVYLRKILATFCLQLSQRSYFSYKFLQFRAFPIISYILQSSYNISYIFLAVAVTNENLQEEQTQITKAEQQQRYIQSTSNV
jgi:hypothetical protein